ncbi:MAG: hypothetical protein JWN48_3659 [Myxococcaceae bacterium]|nr:hypothetical protein [Myxococcaceae bacterium]
MRRQTTASQVAPWWLQLAVLWSACSGGGAPGGQHVEVVNTMVDSGAAGRDAAAQSMDGALADAAHSLEDAALAEVGPPRCGTSTCACADGLDNDADGLIDLDDPDCTSAFGNDEQPYSGIWGDHRVDACQGCFFSGSNGSGADGCRVPYSCLTNGDTSGAGGNCTSCAASEKCRGYCLRYVPNGCDCFGCCTVLTNEGATQNVLLDSTCNVDGDITQGCTACVPSTSCFNPCGRCELCPGKTLAQLPADCVAAERDAGASDAAQPSCEDGAPPCGDALPACATDQMCLYGCCVTAPG